MRLKRNSSMSVRTLGSRERTPRSPAKSMIAAVSCSGLRARIACARYQALRRLNAAHSLPRRRSSGDASDSCVWTHVPQIASSNSLVRSSGSFCSPASPSISRAAASRSKSGARWMSWMWEEGPKSSCSTRLSASQRDSRDESIHVALRREYVDAVAADTLPVVPTVLALLPAIDPLPPPMPVNGVSALRTHCTTLERHWMP